MNKIVAGLFILVAVVGVGCGSSGGAAGSCATSSGGSVVSCTDYNTGYTSSSAMQACTGGATYSSGACPSANRVGRCTITASAGGATASATANYYAPTDAMTARTGCESQNGVGGISAVFTAN